jgi:Fe-Mn family superoxide dismutase
MYLLGRDALPSARNRIHEENTMTLCTRRDILQAAGVGVATLALAPFQLRAEEEKKEAGSAGYKLPPLPYPYDALEPHIDEQTMRIHHDKHHFAYVANANKLLADHPKLLEQPVRVLLANIKEVPEKIRQGVINNAGGHSNHSIFWKIMGPKGGGEPTGPLAKAIDKYFESFDKFQKKLSTAGATQFGSGWAWLVSDGKGALSVVQRANQDSPYMAGLTPLVGVDVWEHAYYLKYKNLRPAYIAAWFKTINWKEVAERHARAMKG